MTVRERLAVVNEKATSLVNCKSFRYLPCILAECRRGGPLWGATARSTLTIACNAREALIPPPRGDCSSGFSCGLSPRDPSGTPLRKFSSRASLRRILLAGSTAANGASPPKCSRAAFSRSAGPVQPVRIQRRQFCGHDEKLQEVALDAEVAKSIPHRSTCSCKNGWNGWCTCL